MRETYVKINLHEERLQRKENALLLTSPISLYPYSRLSCVYMYARALRERKVEGQTKKERQKGG